MLLNQVEEEGDLADIDDELFDDVHDYDYLMMADQPSVDSKRIIFFLFSYCSYPRCGEMSESRNRHNNAVKWMCCALQFGFGLAGLGTVHFFRFTGFTAQISLSIPQSQDQDLRIKTPTPPSSNSLNSSSSRERSSVARGALRYVNMPNSSIPVFDEESI